MFSPDLRQAVSENTPKINPLVARGLITHHVKSGEAYIDSVWKVMSRTFPEGLVYTGFRVLQPREEFDLCVRRNASRPAQIDLARCDLRYVLYQLEYKGVKLPPAYIQLPFFGDGGGLWLSGSRYIHSPVMADSVISVNRTGIFVQLLQIKLVFNRETHIYATNSHTTPREIVPVVWSKVWNGRAAKGPAAQRIPGETTIAHYMYAKFGASQTFAKFANAYPVFGTEKEINEENYPRNEWVICYSPGIQARRGRKRYQEPSELRVAIKHTEYTALTKALIAGLFYITDRFTYRGDYLSVNELSMWRITLGILIFGTDISEGVILTDIDEHIASMDQYVDDMVMNKLALQNHQVKDIYELFAIILNKIDDWIINNDIEGNSVYGKELATLYKLYFDITKSIVRFTFELKKGQRAGRALTEDGNRIVRVLTERNVADALATNVKAGAFFAIKNGHPELTVDDGVNACMPFKATTMVVPQSMASGGGHGAAIGGEDERLHPSWLDALGIGCMSKAQPSGTTRLSPFIQLDEYSRVIANPKHTKLLARVGELMTAGKAKR